MLVCVCVWWCDVRGECVCVCEASVRVCVVSECACVVPACGCAQHTCTSAITQLTTGITLATRERITVGCLGRSDEQQLGVFSVK